eukprot:g8173.t1
MRMRQRTLCCSPRAGSDSCMGSITGEDTDCPQSYDRFAKSSLGLLPNRWTLVVLRPVEADMSGKYRIHVIRGGAPLNLTKSSLTPEVSSSTESKPASAGYSSEFVKIVWKKK